MLTLNRFDIEVKAIQTACQRKRNNHAGRTPSRHEAEVAARACAAQPAGARSNGSPGLSGRALISTARANGADAQAHATVVIRALVCQPVALLPDHQAMRLLHGQWHESVISLPLIAMRPAEPHRDAQRSRRRHLTRVESNPVIVARRPNADGRGSLRDLEGPAATRTRYHAASADREGQALRSGIREPAAQDVMPAHGTSHAGAPAESTVYKR